ncbi:MAG: hypothetical protein N2Z72_01245 [Bacteroidales bacterium]|nr:hypothetical protein [Bacteroidales bacterium]
MNLRNSIIWIGISCSVAILIVLLLMGYIFNVCQQLWLAAFIIITLYSLIAPVLNQRSEIKLSSINLMLLTSSLHLDTLIYVWLFVPCKLSESGFKWEYVIFTALVTLAGNFLNSLFYEKS